MDKIVDLQDSNRKNYNILQRYKTAEDYDRDFISIIKTCRAEGSTETTLAFVSAMLKKI